jgi:hypothetical protein
MLSLLFASLSLLALILVAPGTTAAGSHAAADAPARGPLFIENAGQFDPAARFQTTLGGAAVWLADDAIWLVQPPAPADTAWRSDEMARRLHDDAAAARPGSAVRLRFAGARPVTPEPFGRRDTRLNYYLGDDPAAWRENVPAWSGVRYADLYPGLDLVLGGDAAGLTARFVCTAADCPAALAAVELAVDGATGLALDGASLRITAAAGALNFPLPTAVGPDGAPLDAPAPRVRGAAVLAPIAPAALETTEPTAPAATSFSGNTAELLYGTFLGGAADDYLEAITVDAAGRATVFGDTLSANFPTTPGAFDPGFNGGTFPGGDVVVARLSAAGDELEYATFIGGRDSDLGFAGAVDSSGNTYVTGWTESTNFPTTPGAFDRTHNGDADAYVVKLNNFGGLRYGTYIGGSAAHPEPEDAYDWAPSGFDTGTGLTLDNRGAVLLVGTTRSPDLPLTADAFDRDNLDYCYDESFTFPCADAFVVRLSPSGGALEFASYLGGNSEDLGRALALDTAGRPVIAGDTFSADFPVTGNAFDPNGGGPDRDAFIVRLTPAANAIQYATYIGGARAGAAAYEGDQAGALTLDGANNIILTGQTWSDDFPSTNGAYDTSRNGGTCFVDPYGDAADCPDVFVLRLRADGRALGFSTYIGGTDSDGRRSGEEMGTGVALDALGDVVVTGYTGAPDFPTTPGAHSAAHNNDVDTFVLRLSPDGDTLQYSSFLNIRHGRNDPSVATSSADDVYLTGQTLGPALPMTAGAYDVTHNGGADGFLLRLALGPTPANAGWREIGGGAATGGGISNNAGESARPALVQTADHALVVAWSDLSGGDAEIYVRRWDGAAWSEMGAGSASGGGVSNNSGDSLAPALLAAPGGDLYLAWHDLTPGDAEIYLKRWDGAAWVEVGAGSASGGGISDNKGDSEWPALTLAGDAPVVAWQDTSRGNAEIYLRQWDGRQWAELGKASASGGGISKNSGDSIRPSLAALDGRPAVVWTDNSGGDNEVYIKRWNGSKWVTLGKNSASGGGISNNAGISRGARLISDGSRLTVAWSDDSGGNFDIYVLSYDGKKWSEVGNGSAQGGGISANSGGSQAPTIALTAAGAPLVAWYDTSHTPTAEIFARVWNGVRWEEVTTGAGRGGGISDSRGSSNWPALLVAHDGVPTVAWNDNSGGDFEIYARRASTAVCYRLRLGHVGQGADPVPSPAASFGCQDGWYSAGTIVQLSASPAAGWRVAGWEGTDNNSQPTPTNTLTMPAANHTASVIYTESEATCYPLTLAHLGQGADPSASPGEAPDCPAGQYQAGMVITLQAAPSAGWRVGEWVGTNDDSSALSSNVLTMPASNHTVTVIYVQETAVCHALSQVFTGYGNFPLTTPPASPGCAQGRFIAGQIVTLTARPAGNWQVRDWRGTDDDTAGTHNRITMPDAAAQITVRYTPLPPAPRDIYVPVAR